MNATPSPQAPPQVCPHCARALDDHLLRGESAQCNIGPLPGPIGPKGTP